MTNEMTAEEAVKILRFEQEQVEHRLDGCSDTQENRNIYEAFRMAIKALEQQPSENCINREAVIRLVEQYPNIIGNRCSGLIADIKHLPSVTPKYTDEEIDKAQAIEQAYVDKMVELAVEESKRPKGKWIIKQFDEETGISDSYWCSECNHPLMSMYKEYCPNCGSYNGGGEE